MVDCYRYTQRGRGCCCGSDWKTYNANSQTAIHGSLVLTEVVPRTPWWYHNCNKHVKIIRLFENSAVLHAMARYEFGVNLGFLSCAEITVPKWQQIEKSLIRALSSFPWSYRIKHWFPSVPRSNHMKQWFPSFHWSGRIKLWIPNFHLMTV